MVSIRKLFLIDYENVGSMDFDKYWEVNKEDEVILFFSSYSNKLSIEDLARIQEKEISYTFEKVSSLSENALDFELATCLGVMVGKEEFDKYIIISNDKDFIAVRNFLEKRNIDVLIQQKGHILQKNEKETRKIIEKYYNSKKISKKTANQILKGVNKNKENLNTFLNRCTKNSKLSGEIYRDIKKIS